MKHPAPQPERVGAPPIGKGNPGKAPKSSTRARSRDGNDDRGRSTREQAGRPELFERVDESAEYERPSSLKAPPPRPGYVQRWVRVGMGGSIDEKNLNRKLREGWRARPSNTVPKGFQVPTIKHGDFLGTVMVEGMLLCELPVKMAKKRRDFMRRETTARTRAVNEHLMRVNEGARGSFGPIRKAEESKVARGDEISQVRANVRDAKGNGKPADDDELDLS